MRLSKAITRLLARERVCRVATVDKDGMPHVVPVCHALANGKIYFGAGKGSQKVRHLKANPRLAVLVDLYAEDWGSLKGVMVQGTARLMPSGREFRRIRTLLYQKYPQYPEEAAIEESDSVIVEVTPARVSSW